jgi:hypothetical protein
MALKDAVDLLSSTYLPFDLVVRGMELDAKEVADALAKTTPDTEEETVLKFLAERFPYTPTKTVVKSTE